MISISVVARKASEMDQNEKSRGAKKKEQET